MKLKPEKMQKEINETKKLFFKRSLKQISLQAYRLRKKKKKLDRSYLYQGKKQTITMNPKTLIGSIKLQFYVQKYENIDKMNQYLERNRLPKLTQKRN